MSFGRNFRFGKEGRYNFFIRAEFQNIFNRLFLSPPQTGNQGLGYGGSPATILTAVTKDSTGSKHRWLWIYQHEYPLWGAVGPAAERPDRGAIYVLSCFRLIHEVGHASACPVHDGDLYGKLKQALPPRTVYANARKTVNYEAAVDGKAEK